MLDISRLRQTRKSRNLTQNDVAISLGVTPSFVSQVETGATRAPTAFLQRYAEFLERSIHSLTNQHALRDELINIFKAGSLRDHSLNYTGQPTTEFSYSLLNVAGPNGPPLFPQIHKELKKYVSDKTLQEKSITFLTSGDNRLLVEKRLACAFMETLGTALNKKIPINHIARAAKSGAVNSTFAIFRTALSLALRHLDHERDFPLYRFFVNEVPAPIEHPRDIYLFSDRTALLGFSVRDALSCDDGFAIQANSVIEGYLREFRANSIESLSVFGVNKLHSSLFNEDLSSGQQGDYYMFQGFFISLTRPPRDFLEGTPWYEEAKQSFGPDQVYKIARLRQLRMENFISTLVKDSAVSFKQIACRKQITEWVQTGKIADGFGKRTDIDSERISRLNHIIELLQKYDRFEIAITNTLSFLNEPGWAVLDDYKTVMELPAPRSVSVQMGENRIRGIIRHADVAATFASTFKELWARLPDADKRKDMVIGELQNFRAMLERRTRG